MTNRRVIAASIVGAPNAGKSTLINALCGEKVSIVSPKAQTTRFNVTGIATSGNTQIVYLDTPGIFPAKGKFEKSLVDSATQGMKDVDLIILLVDASLKRFGFEESIIQTLIKAKADNGNLKLFLALNKIDLIEKHQLLKLISRFHTLLKFDETFLISARTSEGIEDLKKAIEANSFEGEWMYPEDQFTNLTVKQMAEEITREKLFHTMQEEIPHSLMVETEKWEEKDNKVTIHQVIVVDDENRKKIIVGKGGQQIKDVGTNSRLEIERLLGKKTNLFLFVKTVKDWKERFLATGNAI